MKFTGSDSEATLEQLCLRLSPVGLVYKEGRTWKVSEQGQHCLVTEDSLYLSAVFCANARFTGELLAKLDTPMKVLELMNIANNDYKLNWETKSEISSRLIWFRKLGLVSFDDFKNTYYLTDRGKEFIENVSYVLPEEIKTIGDLTTEEDEIPVSQWAEKLIHISQEQLRSRKSTIGYIPGSISEVCDTFNGYIQLIYSTVDKEYFFNYTKETYNLSSSSTNCFVTTLANINFLERKSRKLYSATELAKKWLTNKSALDLVYCLHTSVLFVFEILRELEKGSLSAKELAVIAKISYGFETERIEEIRKRLNIMQSALLVQEESPGKYGLTQRARNVLGEVVVQQKLSLETTSAPVDINDENEHSAIKDYLTEIHLALKDSSNPSRFEKAITAAFSNLGFHTSWFGGPGKMDVLLRSPSIPKYSYTVTIDTKSSQSGVVTEGQINFNTLKEHKKLHSADYIAVVGASFQGERLIKRATEHNVVLIDIDSLEKIIRFHHQIPLQANAYKEIFSQTGKVNISCLESERRGIKRSGKLLQAVMNCLVAESEDSVTKGLLQKKDIYRTLRHNKEFEIRPKLGEIAEMLKFLSSPFVGCVSFDDRSRKEFYALGTLSDAVNKFNFYAQSCLVK